MEVNHVESRAHDLQINSLDLVVLVQQADVTLDDGFGVHAATPRFHA